MYKTWLRSKYVLFGIIFSMMVYVWIHNERFVTHSDDPAWKHYETFKWWLLPHILAAASALFLGPMQFSERLLHRYRKLHRVLGRTYVGGALIDRANVGRATFYTHFDNKEDLLLSGFDALRDSLRKRQREALSSQSSVDEGVFAYSYDLLSHVKEHRHLFRAMSGKRSGAAVQNALHKLTIDLVRDDLKAMANRIERPRAVSNAVVEFIAGGLFGLLVWWMGGKAKLSVEELNALFRSFAIPAAKAAV